MKTKPITPALVRQWLERMQDTGVIPWEMKAHVVYLAVAYLKATETNPLLFDPLAYLFREGSA